MKRRAVTIATRIVRAWTWLYTAGMDPRLRDARRAEIDSDLWELDADACRRHEDDAAIVIHIFNRLLVGIPDDLSWRAEEAAADAQSLRRPIWLAATAGFVAIVAVWFLVRSRAPSWPPLPASPRPMLRTTPPPPPPPSPPPPSMVR